MTQQKKQTSDPYRPDPQTELVPSPKWLRVVFGGEVIADSKQTILLRESGKLPVYYFPRKDVNMDFLIPPEATNQEQPTLWTVKVGQVVAKNAAWDYARTASQSVTGLEGYITFKWDKMDAWFEEDEQIFVHPRDPYKRVDALPSSRHVRLVIAGETVADSHRPVLLFETGLLPRYYLPKMDFRFDFLVPSDKQTRCPYKGTAFYYSVKVGDTLVENVVWYYPFPTLEVASIKNMLSFFTEKLDTVYVDGEQLTPQETPWS